MARREKDPPAGDKSKQHEQEASPIYQIRMHAAALLSDDGLTIQSNAAGRRHHEGKGGDSFSNTALFNAEGNGPNVQIETVLGWAAAWGVSVVIACVPRSAVDPIRFSLHTVDGAVKWAAMVSVIEAMGFDVDMRVERAEQAA